jgi:hypothetical protein
MSTRLQLYNNALLLLGERPLASLSEDRAPRRQLDQVWNSDGVRKCLEEGQWRFATRSVQIDYDPDIDPPFGTSRAFSKPTDWVATVALCVDEYFQTPLLQYRDEGGYWYSDYDTMYLRYVSNDDAFGMNIGDWPGWFEEFVAAHFASRIALQFGDNKLENMMKIRQKLKTVALNKDAMLEPTKFPPMGSWNKARRREFGRGERGRRTGDLY